MEGKKGNIGMKKQKKEGGKNVDKSYFRWLVDMERELANILRDERSLGHQGDAGWKPIAYSSASSKLSTQFGTNISAPNVKNRVKSWRKYYGIVSDILAQSGFSWDSSNKMIAVDNDSAWKEYVQDRATGEGAETPFDAEESMGVEEDVSDSDSSANDQANDVTIDNDSTPSRSTTDTQNKKRQISSSSVTSTQKKKTGKKKMEETMGQMAESVDQYFRLKAKAFDVGEIFEVVNAIPDLDEDTVDRACSWLLEEEKQFRFLKTLPENRKKNYLLKNLPSRA